MEKKLNEFEKLVKGKRFNGKIYGGIERGFNIYLDDEEVKLTNDMLKQAEYYIKNRRKISINKVPKKKFEYRYNENGDLVKEMLEQSEIESLIGTNNGKVEVIEYTRRDELVYHYMVRCNYCGKTWEMIRGNILSGFGCASCSRKNRSKKNKVKDLSLKNVNNTINASKTIIETGKYYRIEKDTIAVDFKDDHKINVETRQMKEKK